MTDRFENALSRTLWTLLALWVLFMLLAIEFGWLKIFFFGTDLAGRDLRGVDYYCVPRAFLNLMDSKSIYDTWGGRTFGPGYVTWYPFHPSMAVWMGSWPGVITGPPALGQSLTPLGTNF